MGTRLVSLLLVLLLSGPACAATTVTKTVGPSGADFATIKLALANFTTLYPNFTASDINGVINVIGFSGTDVNVTTVPDYHCDKDHTLLIQATGSGRHNGTYLTGYILASYTSINYALVINNNYTDIDGLSIYANYSTGRGPIYTDASNVTIRNNILFCYTSGGGSLSSGIWADNASGLRIYNNIISNCNGSGIAINSTATGEAYIFENTIFNCTPQGIINTNFNNTSCQNNIAINGSVVATAFATSTSTWKVFTNNIADDGTGNITANASVLFDNYTAAYTPHLYLKQGSPAIDTGATLGAPYNVDIENRTRPFAMGYDIGADESPFSAFTVKPQIIVNE